VTGDTLQKCEQISKNLHEESICVQILSNVLYDAEAMEKLENAKGIVLVETAGSTMYEEVSVNEQTEHLCIGRNSGGIS